jgi:tripeptidyl-peptidase-1
MAGMVNLFNTKRLLQRQSRLGFINPLLYKNPAVFNDIVKGNNRCCASGGGALVCCPAGFDAAVGWDPLTGLGSVDFAKAVSAFVPRDSSVSTSNYKM